ncbi:uncharacterized protein LOC132630522 [Lycium barbarum]|uniref:uncharacterized protein LOC132630522 n=1 Tax=Lycium barbarum TaxID=112863 RepID=UPI00293F7819|nr:uncharacterized protein LOC132630522 [Lycium barbarum]
MASPLPKPLLFDPSTRDKTMWCEFHETLGHKTSDSRNLREEMANMLARGHLREYLSERARNNYWRIGPVEEKNSPNALLDVINIIFGRSMIASTSFPTSKNMKISITREKRVCKLLDEGMITFTDEDAESITLLHNDALVITVFIDRCQVKRIMVDLGSSTNIIRWKVVEEIGLLEKIIPAAKTLFGFNMSSETTKEEIDLPMEAGGIIKMIKFYVIDDNMQYNAIFGRPWLQDMKAIPSTLHLLLKFPTLGGIRQIQGEQPTSKEMFAIEEPDTHELVVAAK